MAFVSNTLNFPNLTLKSSPVSADLLMLADSAASKAIKQTTVGDLVALASSGALTKIATLSASSSASLQFSNDLTSTYDNYVINFEGVRPGTTSTTLFVNVGYGSTPTYDSGSNYAYNLIETTTTNVTGTYNGGTNSNIPLNYSSTTSSYIGGQIIFTGANLGLANGFLVHARSYTNTASTTQYFTLSCGLWVTATVVTSLEFTFSSGNISVGTFKLYGFQN